MNLLHLEYFYTVAKEGGFLRASEKLLINQPAISRMVHSLEENLGFKLFEKVGRNVRLSPRGEEVYAKCKRIFSEVDDLKHSIGKISGDCKGPLIIGASEPIASHFLPKKLSILLKDYPEIIPSIYSGPASMILKKIESGEIEFGLFFHIPELSDRLVIDRKVDVPFRLVIRKDLSKNEAVQSRFIGSREIDDISSKKFPALEILKRKIPKASVKISSNSLTAHKELVMIGLGVSILPEFLIEKEIENKTLLDVIPKEKFIFQMKIIRRKNSIASLNATKLNGLII